ncbi:MAG: hypothetical protein KatS3mg012_0544 [Gaiellaceae bacterium]|nr:MAG: hypothetical protein KatS3mg012_0544 [Gaiellaceae bacterium]
MRARHWFLPEQPDVLGLVRRQLALTREGVDALVEWARGDSSQADRIRALEHRGDELKRELELALTTAFTTPLEPEDLYTLSRGIDWILNLSKDLVRESEVMATPPDDALREMCECLAESVHLLAEAVDMLGTDPGAATERANEALRAERRIEKVYREAMARLLAVDDLREVMARRELYRRVARLGEAVVDVAERVWYAVVKEA